MELINQGFNPNKSHAFFEIPCSDCASLYDLLVLMYEKLELPDFFLDREHMGFFSRLPNAYAMY